MGGRILLWGLWLVIYNMGEKKIVSTWWLERNLNVILQSFSTLHPRTKGDASVPSGEEFSRNSHSYGRQLQSLYVYYPMYFHVTLCWKSVSTHYCADEEREKRKDELSCKNLYHKEVEEPRCKPEEVCHRVPTTISFALPDNGRDPEGRLNLRSGSWSAFLAFSLSLLSPRRYGWGLRYHGWTVLSQTPAFHSSFFH